jgi:hypothetical protein
LGATNRCLQLAEIGLNRGRTADKIAMPRAENIPMEQLKLLMDYTIFHIGVYITLGGLMVSLLTKNTFANQKGMSWVLVASLLCFMFAGIFGGIIAANIPYHTEFTEFINASIGPWFAPTILLSSSCMWVEHNAFWLGIFIFLAGFGLTKLDLC